MPSIKIHEICRGSVRQLNNKIHSRTEMSILGGAFALVKEQRALILEFQKRAVLWLKIRV